MALIKYIAPTDLGDGLAIVANKVVADVDGTSVVLNGSGQIATAIDPSVINDLVTLSGVAANSTDFGTKFTGNIIPDGSDLCAAIQAIETAIESQNIEGQYAGSAATFAALPTTTSDGNAVNQSDWAILTVDDGVNQSGIYVFDGTVWTLGKEIPEVFALVVETANTSAITLTGDGNTGTELTATAVFDPLAGNLVTDDGNGFVVDPADVKAALVFPDQLCDLAGNVTAYVNNAATFA